MKNILLSITFLLFFIAAKAQTTQPRTDTTTKRDTGKTFVHVEQVPEFPGGIDKFYEFIIKSIKYPRKARFDETEGRVVVGFVVERDGSITDIKVVRSLSPECDAEAIRVISTSPKWIPGIQDGHPVRVQYTVPIPFSLKH
jgi:periplasmic protein TonB